MVFQALGYILNYLAIHGQYLVKLFEFCLAVVQVISVATPAFYGYSGSSLTVSQNIAKTVNKALELARRQKIATIYPAI